MVTATPRITILSATIRQIRKQYWCADCDSITYETTHCGDATFECGWVEGLADCE